MQSQSLRVFVSSTYKDLREYRSVVREALNRMYEQDASMEYFGASDYEPTELSLQELTRCNVYLGIIGHRYGTLIPDGRHSITEAEYLHAARLWRAGKIRILLYLADGSVGAGDPPESQESRERQAAFRESLGIHTPQTFRKPYELALFVAADLYKLRNGDLPEGGGPRIFDQDNWKSIEAGFDASEERFKKIEGFLQFITRSFSSLFHIDPVSADVHPFIRGVSKQLREAIPGVSLDARDGTLVRTGVHHIMLRAETAVTLMKNIPPERLQAVAEQIGRSAAEDLIRNRVQPTGEAAVEHFDTLIPASAEALVDLWAYWDRTGGWGKIQLVSANLQGGAPGESSDRRWQLKIENNFLGRNSTAEAANQLAGFWCGYIMGFLNFALPAIQNVMQHLPREQRARVRLPAYIRVASVEHLPDDSPTEDTFNVTFQDQSLSDARRALGKAHDSWKAAARAAKPDQARAHLDDVRAECRFAVLSARHELGTERFDQELARMQLSDEARAVIGGVLAKEGPPVMDQKVAQAWFDACNQLIQQLSVAIEEAS